MRRVLGVWRVVLYTHYYTHTHSSIPSKYKSTYCQPAQHSHFISWKRTGDQKSAFSPWWSQPSWVLSVQVVIPCVEHCSAHTWPLNPDSTCCTQANSRTHFTVILQRHDTQQEFQECSPKVLKNKGSGLSVGHAQRSAKQEHKHLMLSACSPWG